MSLFKKTKIKKNKKHEKEIKNEEISIIDPDTNMLGIPLSKLEIGQTYYLFENRSYKPHVSYVMITGKGYFVETSYGWIDDRKDLIKDKVEFIKITNYADSEKYTHIITFNISKTEELNYGEFKTSVNGPLNNYSPRTVTSDDMFDGDTNPIQRISFFKTKEDLHACLDKLFSEVLNSTRKELEEEMAQKEKELEKQKEDILNTRIYRD